MTSGRFQGSGRAARLALLASALWGLVGFAPTPPESRILFPGHSHVPPAVQAYAWKMIETRCNFQRHELQQHLFWAYQVRTRPVGTGVAYSINILSEVPWKKTLPPAMIEMTVVDDGDLRLAALKSSIVVCTAPLT